MVSTIRTVYGGKSELTHEFFVSGSCGRNVQNISLGGLSIPEVVHSADEKTRARSLATSDTSSGCFNERTH